WIELGKLRGDGARDDPSVVRIGPIVGVAVGMHVSHGPGALTGLPLEEVASHGDIQIARVTRVNLDVATLIDERWEIADLQLEPRDNQEIRFGELEDERRLRVHEVGILIPFRQRIGLDEIAADRLAARGKILSRG